MIICLVAYAIIAFLAYTWKRQKLFQKIDRRTARRIAVILLAANTLSLIILLAAGNGDRVRTYVSRNSYGEGEKTEELKVQVAGELEEESIEIAVGELAYSEEEAKEVLQKCCQKLDRLILGENRNVDHVDHDLQLVTRMPEEPVEISWTLDHYEALDASGHIQKEHTSKNGTLVKLTGVLTYREQQAVYEQTVKVFPPVLTRAAAVKEQLTELIRSEDEENPQDKKIKLPLRLNGSKVLWKRPADRRGYYVLALGILAAVLIGFQKTQDRQRKQKERERKLKTAYPDLLNEFALLLKAGMNTKQVWFKISEEYLHHRGQGGNEQPVYEEMVSAVHHMQGGLPEKEAYEKFGKRCGMPDYVKFASLLIQNLVRGTKGIAEQLTAEASQAYQNRKARAKQRGEEAGTKLLFPMFLMLAVVLVIIMVPAFLSVQL